MLTTLVISDEGEGYELAYRLTQEGQNSKFCPLDRSEEYPAAATELKGQSIDKYEEHLVGADLVITCGSTAGRIGSQLATRGIPVLGGRLAYELVADAELGRAVVRMLGQAIGERTTFGTRVSGFAFRGDLLAGWNSIHYNRMLDGDRGPLVPSMGCTAWASPDLGLHAITPILRAYDYTGFASVEYNDRDEIVEINLDNHGDHVYSFLAGCRGRSHQILFDLSRGRSVNMTQCATAVKLGHVGTSASPTLNDQAQKHYWAGRAQGYWGTVTASGDTVREARRRAYRTIRNIAPIDLLYRNGIGLTLEDREGGLHES